MDWFKQMSGLEIAYFVIACIGSLLLLIQIVMMIIGAADGGMDLDTDTDADGDLDSFTDTGVSLFTTKGLTAFFAIGGWTGLTLLSYDVNTGLSIAISVAAGLAAYLLVWGLIRLILRMQEDGTVDYGSAVGKSATVYVSIPGGRSGRGKVTLVLQGRYTEADAITDETERIPVDAAVEIVGMVEEAYLVKRVSGKEEPEKAEEKRE